MLVSSLQNAGSTKGVAPRLQFAAPEIAVVITCRNYENLVEDAIASVAFQTYPHFKCVIVDDASTDGSIHAIEKMLAELNDPRFSVLRLSENVGQLMAFRLGLASNLSHFAAFLDADDYWLPRFLECHIRAHLNTVCSAPISSSDAWIVDVHNTALEGTFFELAKNRYKITKTKGLDLPDNVCPTLEGNTVVMNEGEPLRLRYVPRAQHWWHWVNTSAMVFRRDFVDIAIPPDGEPRRRHADYYLAHLAHFLGGSLIIPEALGVYRMHRGNLFANLPRIGSLQNVGIEPPLEARHTHERLALHVMKNWEVFNALVGPEALGGGLRRFIKWRELDELAAMNGISSDIRQAALKAVRSARAKSKHGVARLAVKYFGF